LSDLREIQTSMQNSIVAQTQSVLTFQRESQTRIESRLRAIERRSENPRQSSEIFSWPLEEPREDLKGQQTKLHQGFDSLEMLERTTTIADRRNEFSQETLSKIIRTELRNIMNSMIDDTVAPTGWKRDRFERHSAAISDDVGQSFQKDDEVSNDVEIAPETPRTKAFQAYPLISSSERAPQRRYRMKKKTWRYCFLFGSLMVHITTLESLTEFSDSRIITITVTFVPSSRLSKAAMSAAVRLNASHTGYWEIGPIFRIINIISDDAEIWDYIESGDLHEVQRLFKNRQVSVRDCDSDGDTLLHVSD
jgi:hypothetical protein